MQQAQGGPLVVSLSAVSCGPYARRAGRAQMVRQTVEVEAGQGEQEVRMPRAAT